MHKKKIVIFGSQKLAIDIINFLKNKCDIILVVTSENPDDRIYGYDSLREICGKLKIELFYESLNGKIFNKIKKINPDIILSIYYRRIFPLYFIKYFRGRILNFHPSLLPFYRGPVPTAWAILKNETYSGLTIHEVTRKIDGGDIVFQKAIKIPHFMSGFEFHKYCMKYFFIFFKKIYRKIILKQYIKKKQISQGSYYGKLPSVGLINWQSKGKDLVNFIRVYAKPYNVARCRYANKILFINKLSIFSYKNIYTTPGRIVKITNKNIYVQCADSVLKIDEYYFYPKLNKKEKNLFLKQGKIIK